VLWLDGKPLLHDLFGADDDKDRRTLLRHVGDVVITTSKHGRWEAISDRIDVRWMDGSQPVVAA